MMDTHRKYNIKAVHKSENMHVPKKYDRKAAIKASYKSSYGNRQSGVGRAIVAKDLLKKKYEKLKYKEEVRKRKEEYYAAANQEVSEAELRFLPAVVPAQEEGAEDGDGQLDDNFVKRRKPSRMVRAKLEFKKNVSEKQRLKEERRKKLQEKQAKLAAKKEEALRRNKKFSQKTRRGQPLMSARLDLLIDKINARWGNKT